MLELWDSTYLFAISLLYHSWSGLLIPLLLFSSLALIVKRKRILQNIPETFSESVFNFLIVNVNALIVTPIILWLSPHMSNYVWILLDMSEFNPILCSVLAVIVGDFVGYWRHRLEHIRWLWPSHATHHSDANMSWLTLERIHPINRVTTFVIDSTLLLMMGFPPYAILVNNLVRHYYGYFIHADVPWTYGRLSQWLVSPVLHRWHHANVPQAFNSNFATVFSFYDRLFGTYYMPGQCTAELGVDGLTKQSLFHHLAYPFRVSSYQRIEQYNKRPVRMETVRMEAVQSEKAQSEKA